MVKVSFLEILLRMVAVTLAGVVLEGVVAVLKGMVAEGEEVLHARTTLLLVKLMLFQPLDTFLSRTSSEDLMPLTFARSEMSSNLFLWLPYKPPRLFTKYWSCRTLVAR